MKLATKWQNIWQDTQTPTDDKRMSFRDFSYEKLNKNLERVCKPDTNHRKQHTMQHQDYDELYTQTQNVTPINVGKEEIQISIPGRQLSFLEGSQIIS